MSQIVPNALGGDVRQDLGPIARPAPADAVVSAANGFSIFFIHCLVLDGVYRTT